MTPAEKLKAAAERLETLDKAASESPWEVIEKHGFDYSGEGYSTVTLTMRETDGDVAKWYGETERERPDADLIATLRPLAPVIAKQLRGQALIIDATTRLLRPTPERNYPLYLHDLCGQALPVGGRTHGSTCRHFDDALALADAVLAATS